MTKKLNTIKVETLNNGYSLSVNKNKYMYYDEKELSEGFIYHVCFGELEYINKKEIKHIIESAIAWRSDKGKTTKEIMRLKEENSSLQSNINYLKRLNENLRNKVKRFKKQFDAIGISYKDESDKDNGDDKDDEQ